MTGLFDVDSVLGKIHDSLDSLDSHDGRDGRDGRDGHDGRDSGCMERARRTC